MDSNKERDTSDIDDNECKKWVTLSYWTPGEAAALLLGKNPEYLNIKNIDLVENNIKFEFKHLRRRIQREKFDLGQMNPKVIIKWAENNGIYVPDVIINNIKNNKSKISTYKSRERRLIKKNNNLEKKIELLESLEDSRIVKNLYKMIIATCYDCYGYRVNVRGNTVPSVANALIRIGLKLDEGTIRSALGRAYDLIDNEATRDILSGRT